jgi:prolyl 4-hydroxylase
MIVFENCIKGTTDIHPNSLHAGMPVIKGEKYAINLWFREMNCKKEYDFPFLLSK